MISSHLVLKLLRCMESNHLPPRYNWHQVISYYNWSFFFFSRFSFSFFKFCKQVLNNLVDFIVYYRIDTDNSLIIFALCFKVSIVSYIFFFWVDDFRKTYNEIDFPNEVCATSDLRLISGLILVCECFWLFFFFIE